MGGGKGAPPSPQGGRSLFYGDSLLWGPRLSPRGARIGVRVRQFDAGIGEIMTKSAKMIITPDFDRALAAVEAGDSVFITGKAGTGKSTLLRHIRSLYSKRDLAVVAPTGVAALNVDGRTIHDYFAFRMGLTSDLREYRSPQRLDTMDMLVIDEVSMVKAPLMDMMCRALRRAKESDAPFGGTQTLFIGDLYQLPPVQEHRSDDPEMEGYATPFFFSSESFRQLDVKTIELNTVFRQRDASFVALLNAIRDGTFTDADLEKLNTRIDAGYRSHSKGVTPTEDMTVTLASTNEYVNDYNLEKLAELPGKETRFPAEQFGVADNTKAGKFGELKDLRLKAGAQVMLQVNQQGYVNGSMGTVTQIAQDAITVHVPDLGEEVEVRRYTWETYETRREGKKLVKEVVGRFTQFPLKLAWAVTVHKSQGKTFDRVVYDCGSTFEAGMAYVALSRCTSLEGITLTQPVQSKHIKVHPSVVRFHRKATAKRQPLGDLPVACVGCVATGTDRYRKLVEIAVVRYEHGKEVLRLSSLIQPERDASKAVLAGINAAELSLAPRVEEVQPLVAMALNGAVIVGSDTEEVLEKIRFPPGQVDEGVGVDVSLSDADNDAHLPALAIADQVAKQFLALGKKQTRDVQVAPFRTDGWQADFTPYLFSRDEISSARAFHDRCVKGREMHWNKDLMLGYVVGILSHPMTQDPESVQELVGLVDPVQAAAIGELLVARVKEDKLITDYERDFLARVQATLRCSLESVRVGNFREKVTLEPGMRVYISGGPAPSGSVLEGLRKEDIKEMCSHTELIFESQFQKKTNIDVLAIADPSNVTGGSYGKASRWGIPVISWEELVAWAESVPE